MPFRTFVCGAEPCTFTGVGMEAQTHFSEAHRAEGYCMPPAMVRYIEDGFKNEARRGESLTPSMAGGCMREHALARTKPFDVEPMAGFAAFQGSMFHYALQKHSASGWYSEVGLPSGGTRSWVSATPSGVLAFEPKVELWPGICLTGTADVLKEDFSELHDYKTAKEYGAWSRALAKRVVTHYPPRDEQKWQVNIYCRMVEKLTGKMPQPGIWKIHIGGSDPREAIRFYPQEVLSLGELKEKVVEGPNGWRRFLEVMREPDLEKRMGMIAEMPLAGRVMLNGTKCEKYCGQKKACDALIPMEERW